MKVSSVLAITLTAASVRAQYFNEGWKPGKPVQLPVDNLDQAGGQQQQQQKPFAGWTPPAPPSAAEKKAASAAAPSSSTDDEETPAGIKGLFSKLMPKAQPNTTFNPAILTISHTPDLAPLWGKHDHTKTGRRSGLTVEEQLNIPRSSVVSAARGAKAMEENAPWSRARMAGGAAGSGAVGSGTKGASALSFEPWVVLVSGRGDDKVSNRFNRVFNDTINLIHPPPEGQGPAPLPSDEPQPEEDADEVKYIEDLLLKEMRTLKSLRFATANFITEPEITWHWWIWKVPTLLFITPSTSPERAYDIRFWNVAVRPPSKARLLAVLSDENRWKNIPIWTSKMAPGGERDHIPERLSNAFSYVYAAVDKIPSPVLPVIDKRVVYMAVMEVWKVTLPS
ncbi:hypothetical protein OC846_000044 [Tilletia horrida]|uniref:Uncharacterized protein n=1 Tax=Tilletia horrida TaxID=155126 RepID=A0AAN6GWK2_9BASI|nr:hypothetical protein OC846_000044 [Tilletia horrida]